MQLPPGNWFAPPGRNGIEDRMVEKERMNLGEETFRTLRHCYLLLEG